MANEKQFVQLCLARRRNEIDLDTFGANLAAMLEDPNKVENIAIDVEALHGNQIASDEEAVPVSIQVMPDWREPQTAEQFNKNFGEGQRAPLSFAGPGFYLTKTDTILVVPTETGQTVMHVTRDNVWHVAWPSQTVYDVNIWNCSFNETIFAALGSVPMRHDAR